MLSHFSNSVFLHVLIFFLWTFDFGDCTLYCRATRAARDSLHISMWNLCRALSFSSPFDFEGRWVAVQTAGSQLFSPASVTYKN